jgi:hypothetical protein
MEHTLYFMVDNVQDAKKLKQEVRQEHNVDDSNISFYAKNREDLGDLTAMSKAQRTFLVSGSLGGMLICAGIGFIAGVLTLIIPSWNPPWFTPASPLTIIAITTVAGAIFGAIWTMLFASMLPNEILTRYKRDIDNGRVLMIVRVPAGKADDLSSRISRDHHEAIYLGCRPRLQNATAS